MFVVLWVRHVPFAAPLAVFEAAVSTFIPVVGTYIGGAAPVLAALLTDPVDAIIVLAWIVVYQQIENYFLAPRLTARDHVRVRSLAFAAAMAGGALGGFLFAFLALPSQASSISSADPRPPVQGHRQCRGQRRRWKRVNPSEARQTSPPHPGIISSAAAAEYAGVISRALTGRRSCNMLAPPGPGLRHRTRLASTASRPQRLTPSRMAT